MLMEGAYEHEKKDSQEAVGCQVGRVGKLIRRRSPERSQINAIHESGTTADNDHQLTRTLMDRNSLNHKSSAVHNRRLVTLLNIQTDFIAKSS